MNTTLPLVVLVAVVAAGLAAGLVALALRRRTAEAPPSQELAPALAAQAARLDRLADAVNRQATDASGLRGDLGRAKEVLEALRSHADEQRRAAQVGWEGVRRLESVLAGAGARGRSGENVLEDALDALPPDMISRDFRVNGRVVEFALVLPDGRRMPIDSKWTAMREVEALEAEEDPLLREPLARDVERCVVRRAAEVAAYIDGGMTTPFAVACIPDPAFRACRRAHAEAFARGVVLISYSTALPVVLALYSLAVRHGAAGDAEGALAELAGLVESMEQTLENKVARATTMLQNAAVDWRTHLGKARGALARGRGSVALDDEEDEPPIHAVGG